MVGVIKDRVRPLDDLLNRCRNGLIPGLTYGVWLFFAVNPVELTVFGIGTYPLRSLLMMDVALHIHLEMSGAKWLNAIFLCPYYHQLQYSIEPCHYKTNYGLLLSIWDRAFGTLMVPEHGEHFTFGLSNNEHDEFQSLLRFRVVAVVSMTAILGSWFGGARAPADAIWPSGVMPPSATLGSTVANSQERSIAQ